jgi:hypothetical protein
LARSFELKLLIALALSFASLAVAQVKDYNPLKDDRPVVWADPKTFTTPDGKRWFRAHFFEAKMAGQTKVPKNGVALVALVDFFNVPKGYAHQPSCVLTHNGKPANIKSWIDTGRTDYFSFKAKPGMEVDFSCTGWAYR